MPILGKENDIHPEDLFDRSEEYESAWLFYILSRREKEFMRQLYALKIAFFGPTIEKKYRSPNGRFRTSYVPLFSNYVFVFGNEDQRYSTMTTNCVSRYTEIQDRPRLFKDLCQVHQVLSSGVAITQEQKLSTGDPVVVKNGPFKGFEGHVVRRENQTRLLVYVKFIEQGVSMEIDESQLQGI
jgi:transcription antitermination factor NusG